MASSKTNQLYQMYRESLRFDTLEEINRVVAKYVQPWYTEKICFIEFDSESEYDDNGGYYDTISSITILDMHKDRLDWEDDIKSELFEEAPDVYDLVRDQFWEISRDLREVDLYNTVIEIKEVTVNE